MIHLMLPEQYLRQPGARVTEPQRKLMLAVLQTVVEDCRSGMVQGPAGLGTAADRRALEQAREYVASTDRAWPFSFENVCEAIGLDAIAIRRALQRDDGMRAGMEPEHRPAVAQRIGRVPRS